MSSLASATSKMFSGTLVSRILGQVRLIVLIGALGATAQADAFQVANTLPNTIYNLIAGGVMNAILVPHIVKAMKRRDNEFVNRLLTTAGALLFGLTVILTAASSILITIFASQMAPEWFPLAIAFAYWCVPQVFFYGMYTLLGNVLNARGVFGPYMWAPVVNNVIAIAGLLAYIWIFGGADVGADPAVWDSSRIAMVGGFATLGVALQAIVLIIPLRRSGFTFRFRWGVRGSGLGDASRMAVWVFAALLVGQLGNLVLVNVASAANRAAEVVAAAGGGFVPSYVAYTGAFAIFMLPQSLITVSLVTALFTRMAEHATEGDIPGVRNDLSFGLRTIGVFTVFASAAFVVLAIPLVQAALPTTPRDAVGGFAAVLVALSLGIPGQALWTMVQRVSFAFEDARTMFFIQIPMALIVVAGGVGVFVAPAHLWVVIVCLAMSASMWLGGLVGFLSLRKHLRLLDGTRVFRTYLRLAIAVIPATAVGWGVLQLWGPLSEGSKLAAFALGLTKTFVVGSIMAAIYFMLLRALKVKELDGLLAPLLRRLRRNAESQSVLPRTSSTIGRDVTGADGRSAVLPIADGDLIAGRFHLETLTHTTSLGAELWIARDAVMDRDVAALLAPSEIRDSVLDGARRAAILTDPRLASIVDVGEQGGVGYVISARPAGRNVAGLTVTDDVARAIVGECAAALDAGRKRGIHHGALTSECVRVTPTGEVVLLGLGYLGAAGVLTPVLPGTGAELASDRGTTQPDPEPNLESRDPVERSIARSRWDAAALLAMHGTLSGSEEQLVAKNAGEVMRAMTPWGNIVLPPEPGPSRATPLWKRLRGRETTSDAVNAPSAAAEEPRPIVATGGPAAASLGSAESIGPAATLDTSRWGLPPVPGSAAAPPFDEILDVDDAIRTTPAAHIGKDLPASTIATAAAAAAAGATSTFVAKWAKNGASFAKEQAEKVRETQARLAQERAERKEEQAAEAAKEAQERSEREAAEADDAALLAASSPPETTEARAEPPTTEKWFGTSALSTHLPTAKSVEAAREAALAAAREAARRRIDPGPFVLAIVAIAVVLAVIYSLSTLRDREPLTLPPRTDPVPAVTEPAEDSAEGTDEDSADDGDEAELGAEPVIARIEVLDPEGDGQENQELTGRAFDGDTTTYWRSRSYVNPSFGIKSGIGIDIVLKKPALVTEIEILLAGEGGHVQVKTDAATANRQDPIAEADMERITVITLDEPTELSNVVLWFTSLPTADSDGKNRVELLEVEVR